MSNDLNNGSSNTGAAAPDYTADARTLCTQPDDEASDARSERRRLARKAAKSLPVWVVLPALFALGVLLCELVVREWSSGVGLTLTAAAACALSAAFILRKESISLRQLLLAVIPTALLALSFSFNASRSGRGWMVLLLFVLMALLNTVMSGRVPAGRLFSGETALDVLGSHTVEPIKNLVPAFGGLFEKASENKKTGIAGKIGRVAVGLILSVPVVLILGRVLVGADAVFEEFVRTLIERTEKLDIRSGRIIGDALLGCAVCLFGIPLAAGLRAGRTGERRSASAPRWLDPITGATVAYAAGAVYVLFVAVQIGYFFPVSVSYYFGNHDFSRRLTLPENMTWAEYARSGFFELSGIIIASFVAIAAFMLFTRRDEKGNIPACLRIALTVIAGCNIIMAVSAVMRMGLYTIWCGLTAKRIGVLMIIAVIAVSLAAVIIKLWHRRLPLTRIVAITALCAALCFGCMNVERVCAEVNVSRHIEQGTTVDMCYLGELSVAAAPAVERLMLESPDENVRAAAQGLLARYYFLGNGPMGYQQEPLEKIKGCEMTLDHWRAFRLCTRDINGNGVPELLVSFDMVRDYSIYADWQQEKRDFERWSSEEFVTFEQFCERVDRESWYFESYSMWYWEEWSYYRFA